MSCCFYRKRYQGAEAKEGNSCKESKYIFKSHNKGEKIFFVFSNCFLLSVEVEKMSPVCQLKHRVCLSIYIGDRTVLMCSIAS